MFSIVAPVYNVEPYLPQCMESVLAQSFGGWELILVDDGSPDGSPTLRNSALIHQHLLARMDVERRGVRPQLYRLSAHAMFNAFTSRFYQPKPYRAVCREILATMDQQPYKEVSHVEYEITPPFAEESYLTARGLHGETPADRQDMALRQGEEPGREVAFTFIIPHKNSPQMLQRLIGSIPERDDVEIVVVDDNSEKAQRPVLTRRNATVIHLDANNSKGAGHARNVGLAAAQGKWVLFADADDKYSTVFPEFLDKYKDSEADVVYFNYDQVRGDVVTRQACPYINLTGNDNKYRLKYLFTVPWNKMTKLRLIREHVIEFEECPVGNDIFFTYQVAYFSKSIAVEPASMYVYYINSGSIGHKKKNDKNYYLTICKHIYQRNEFFKFLGHADERRTMASKLAAILIKKGFPQFVFALNVYIKNYAEIKRDRFFFVNRLR